MASEGINYRPLPRNGMHISCEEFNQDREDGVYNDEEGYGFYATNTMVSDVAVKISTKKKDKTPDVFTHVWWFSE